jgi:hypothetical protein
MKRNTYEKNLGSMQFKKQARFISRVLDTNLEKLTNFALALPTKVMFLHSTTMPNLSKVEQFFAFLRSKK